jgi:hypothetical protein
MPIMDGRHPVAVGDQTTAMVLAKLLQVYPNVLIPFGENQRYDLLIDEDDKFTRVQCKTGRLRAGVVRFSTCSFTYHHPNNRGSKEYSHTYYGQADLFGVYCADTGAVYLVPVEDVGVREGTLRVAPTKNSQAKKVRWASQYELKSAGLAQLARAFDL